MKLLGLQQLFLWSSAFLAAAPYVASTPIPSLPPTFIPTVSASANSIMDSTEEPSGDSQLETSTGGVPASSPTTTSEPIVMSATPGPSSIAILATPPPTVDGKTTVYIRINAEKPRNIGWHIGDESLDNIRVAVPFNAYFSSDTEIMDQVSLPGGQGYQFVIKSKMGDDLGAGGSYEVVLGEEFSSQVLAEGNGNFGQEATSVFYVPGDDEKRTSSPAPSLSPIENAQPSSLAPTDSPLAPTTSGPSRFPTAAPTETDGAPSGGSASSKIDVLSPLAILSFVVVLVA